ncbi:SRPBCC family protein [Microbacterium sp. zg.Y909]|uniref:SRPBCC family protein n=1 Tax=Microbacterium sp. zg.Y909 TaxID=2969413 RepID=UPI00214ACECA|nr:SRPBCC family protein [Microbacterium sp. zg.Y909]MCR2826324.1 SRPBCC family protein [Microbacterium sp. zg.Y909]
MTAGNARVMRCTPDDVFAVLADGWLYPVWVVGASRMRAVAPEWPEPGSKIHHSVGAWPILIDDETEVVEWSPSRRLRLRAKGGPIGRAVVAIDVREHGDGCLVRIGEEPVTGPARLLPRAVWAPLMRLRNRETLRRLAFLAEGRRLERQDGGQMARPHIPETADTQAGSEARDDVAAADEAHEAVKSSGMTDAPDGDAAGDATGDDRAADAGQADAGAHEDRSVHGAV